VVLFIAVFPYDTPPMLKQRGQYDKLKTFMGKIYAPYVIQEKIEELNQMGNDSMESV
jgi:hypothetical protein